MIQSPQSIQVSRAGLTSPAVVAWRFENPGWAVSIESAEFEPVEAHADDAFEALCLVREQLEPHGWLLGVAGAQLDVWPSGMARDQGGGKVAYRMTIDGAMGVVDTFQPVDPATVTTVTHQRAEYDRLLEAWQQKG